MPSKRTFAYIAAMIAAEYFLARQGEGLLARSYFEDLAQAEYDREFWDLVGADE